MAKSDYKTNTKARSATAGLWGSLIMFAIVVAIFIAGTDSLSSGSNRRQKESLENAINRDVVYCYATTGKYPESLDYIRKNYGLYYNEDLFFVDYQIRGSNLFPDVTIIELTPKEDLSLPGRCKVAAEHIIAKASQFKNNFRKNILARRKENNSEN